MSGIFLKQMNKTRNKGRVGENELTGLSVLGRVPVDILLLLIIKLKNSSNLDQAETCLKSRDCKRDLRQQRDA